MVRILMNVLRSLIIIRIQLVACWRLLVWDWGSSLSLLILRALFFSRSLSIFKLVSISSTIRHNHPRTCRFRIPHPLNASRCHFRPSVVHNDFKMRIMRRAVVNQIYNLFHIWYHFRSTHLILQNTLQIIMDAPWKTGIEAHGSKAPIFSNYSPETCLLQIASQRVFDQQLKIANWLQDTSTCFFLL